MAATLHCAPAARGQPGNDTCAQALTGYAIPPGGGTVMGTLSGASRDALGTTCPGNQTGVDAYHTITPTVTGIYTFETCGITTWDTVLSVHTACPVSVANQVPGGCNDDNGCGFQSHVGPLLLLAGQTYILRVGSYSSATAVGPYAVAVTFTARAPNDECNATNPPIPTLALDTPLMGDNTGASTSLTIVPSSMCGGYAGSGGGADLFYRFVAPGTAAYIFSTCGSALDSVLSVHSACPATSANVMACNDDAGAACPSNSLNSQVSVVLSAGQTCYVRVAGYYDPSLTPRTGTFFIAAHRDSTVVIMGACCGPSAAPGCTMVASGTCSGTYQGDSTSCSPDPCPMPTGACCWSAGGCTLAAPSDCAGAFQGPGSVCGDNCPGVCCIGACCVLRVSTDCLSPGGSVGALWVGSPSCGASASANTPCCRADFNKSGSVSVQDIFDYLNAWFAGSPFTHLAGPGQSTVQDIFDYLSVWFAGGC
jgi:hypothetical protein